MSEVGQTKGTHLLSDKTSYKPRLAALARCVLPVRWLIGTNISRSASLTVYSQGFYESPQYVEDFVVLVVHFS